MRLAWQARARFAKVNAIYAVGREAVTDWCRRYCSSQAWTASAMTSVAIVLALGSAFCFGAALLLTQFGLRGLSPLSGAAISIPASTLLLICAAPLAMADGHVSWGAVPIFAAVGLVFPGVVTLLTFEANRLLGPVITGTLGNLTPLFAVALAVVMLGEPLRPASLGGLLLIVVGVVIMTSSGPAETARWRSWYLLLPLTGAAIRGFVQPAVKLGLEIWPSPFGAALTSYIVSSAIVIAATRWGTGSFAPRASTRSRLWFAGVGVCNGLAVLLMYAALANGPVTLVSPLVAVYPLVTVAGSMFLFGRTHGGPRLALAVMLTVLGVALLIAG
jgi:drug/metabolite transporter (DMT)-like permease